MSSYYMTQHFHIHLLGVSKLYSGDVVAKWIVHGNLNPHIVGLSLSAASLLTMQHPWARCALHACLCLERGWAPSG